MIEQTRDHVRAAGRGTAHKDEWKTNALTHAADEHDDEWVTVVDRHEQRHDVDAGSV